MEAKHIDLSGDVHRRVIVDQVDGLYLGQPHTVLLRDGKTMLVAYPLGHGGPGHGAEEEPRRRADLERPAAGSGQLCGQAQRAHGTPSRGPCRSGAAGAVRLIARGGAVDIRGQRGDLDAVGDAVRRRDARDAGLQGARAAEVGLPGRWKRTLPRHLS